MPLIVFWLMIAILVFSVFWCIFGVHILLEQSNDKQLTMCGMFVLASGILVGSFVAFMIFQ